MGCPDLGAEGMLKDSPVLSTCPGYFRRNKKLINDIFEILILENHISDIFCCEHVIKEVIHLYNLNKNNYNVKKLKDKDPK